MEYIQIKDTARVYINHYGWQTAPSGEKFRMTGLRVNLKVKPIYVNEKGEKVDQYAKGRIEKHHWIYTFIYESGRTFEIEIDYNDKFLSLTKK